MRPPSRSMPKYTPPPVTVVTVLGWMGMLLGVGVMGWAVFQLPWWGMGLIVVGMAVINRVANRKVKARLTAWAAGRDGDSICTFAKSFPRREVDTWVIRAVYEQLQAYLAFAYPQFPIRAEDGLDGGLITDPDDSDLEALAQEIAVRTGRSLVDAQRNPYYGKVQTVRDLVLFFNAQPRSAS